MQTTESGTEQEGGMSAAPGRSQASSHSSPQGEGAPVSHESLLDTFKGMWQELPGLLSDRIELLSVELQRAGLALLHLVLLGIALAVLGITAWLMLWGLFVAGLAWLGLHWVAALLIGFLAQLALVAWVVHRGKTLLPLLQLPATRRRLTPSPSASATRAAPGSENGSRPEPTAHDTAPST